jgi:hypothetical protein
MQRSPSGRVQPLAHAWKIRDLSVSGLDDPGGAVLALHPRELRARVDPERVVAAAGAQIGAVQRLALVLLIVRALTYDLRMRGGLRLDLARRNDQRRVASGSLQRSDSGVGPIALETRATVQRPRRPIAGRALIGVREYRNADHAQECDEATSAQHVPSELKVSWVVDW